MEEGNAGGILLRLGKMKHVYSGYTVVISLYFEIITYSLYRIYFRIFLDNSFCLIDFFYRGIFHIRKSFLGKLTICRWV